MLAGCIDVARVGQRERRQHQQHRVHLVGPANALVCFAEMRHDASLVACEALKRRVYVREREIARARKRRPALPCFAFRRHMNHALRCQHFEYAARMRGKSSVACAILEKRAYAQRIEVGQRDCAAPTGLRDMSGIDGRISRKRERDRRVFALISLVELGYVALKVGDGVGELAGELVGIAD